MNNSRVIGVTFLLLFSVYGYFTADIPLDFWSEEELFNARSLPYAIAAAGILISFLLIALPSPATEWKTWLTLDWLPAVLLLLTMSLYGLVFEYLGFILSTISFLIISYFILGERRVGWMLVGSVPLVLGFWLLMDFLGIYLEPGELYRLLAGSSDA
jgi:putative tricarboxylic transport membrane protein